MIFDLVYHKSNRRNEVLTNRARLGFPFFFENKKWDNLGEEEGEWF
jgi:hypothetical protein